MIKVMVRLKDRVVGHHTSEKPEVVIGRDAACDVPIDNPLISRQHARIFRQGSDYFIEDLKSANGCFLHGQKVEAPARLSEGDRIEIGKFLVEFHSDAAGGAPPPGGEKTSAAHRPTHQDDVLMTMQVDVRSLREQLKNAPVHPSAGGGAPAAPATTPVSSTAPARHPVPAAKLPWKWILRALAIAAVAMAIYALNRR